MKKIAFTIADEKNMPYAKMMENSLRKFHSEEELPLIIITGDELNALLAQDNQFFYRATPIIANKLFDEGYDLVIKIDADSLVVGKLDYVFDSEYEVGTVYNWNRVDPEKYGEIGVCTIQPIEYYNCGFVAMKSHKFVKHWLHLCMSPHFERMPMREQGFLNVLTHYGFYKTMCFDDFNPFNFYSSWHGLRSKSEWNKIVLKTLNNEKVMVLPQGREGYPEQDKIIRVVHWAGGNEDIKMNYKVYFSDEVSSYLDELTNG
jgi:hypothetical protein